MTHEAIKYAGYIKPTHELGLWTRILAIIRNFINNYIPEGYQDENGFHFGAERNK